MNTLMISLFQCALAQSDGDPISIGEYKILHSDILDEDRLITIHLPDGYEDSGLSYPVIYLSYGDRIEQYFAEATSIVHNLTEIGPKVILIGIDERNLRYRDLLPLAQDGSATGIDTFTNYLTKELIPHVKANYRTKEYRIFVGPQVGANFGLYTLFQNPDLFDAYILNNPFRWKAGRELLFENIRSYISGSASLNKFLFITHHDENELEVEGNAYIEEFKEIIRSANLEGFDAHFNFLENRYSYTIGLRKALKLLFNDYVIPKDRVVNDLQGLINYYSELSRKLGYEVDIPERTLAEKSDQLMETKEYEKVEELLKHAETIYPNGFNALWRFGNLYRVQGNKDAAISYYRKVMELYPWIAENAQKYIDELSK